MNRLDFLYVLLIVIAVLVLQRKYYYMKCKINHYISGVSCESCRDEPMDDNNTTGKINNINHPLYNVREAAKQCVLIEGHCEIRENRCGACLKKHNLILEALFEEASGLDRHNQYSEFLRGKPELVRSIFRDFADHKDYKKTAQRIRDLRRECIEIAYDHFK